jgi:hypothetical protein
LNEFSVVKDVLNGFETERNVKFLQQILSRAQVTDIQHLEGSPICFADLSPFPRNPLVALVPAETQRFVPSEDSTNGKGTCSAPDIDKLFAIPRFR